MIPKPFKQKVHYNDLIVPKDHRETAQRMSMDIWNQLGRINSAFPNEEITVDHFLREMGGGLYTIDMKVTSTNSEVQKHLDQAYRQCMYWPRFERPEILRDSDFGIKK